MASSADNQQFIDLYRACEKDLFHYILSLAPQHVDALDILQETASELWNKFDHYDQQRPFKTWALKFAHLHVLKHRQRAKTRKRDLVLLGENALNLLAEEHERYEGVLELRRKALPLCMDKLSEADRQLLTCRYWSDETLRDLAQSTGRPEHRLHHRLVRIRKMLQECINETLPSLEES